jgi:DNA-binding response OmpR family regulator
MRSLKTEGMPAGKKILIIDDDAQVASAYQEQLEREGYTVEICSDGGVGYYRLHELGPDGVLLDLVLPGISGVDILRKIRAQKKFQKLPVIALSNAFMVTLLSEALEAGATRVFNKASSSPAEIVEALSEAVFPRLSPELRASALKGEGTALMANAASSSRPSAATALPKLRMSGPEEEKAGKPSQAESRVAQPEEYQMDLRGKVVKDAQQLVVNLGEMLTEGGALAGDAVAQKLADMCRSIHSLTGKAALAGFENIAHMASALEALLKELSNKPANFNVSSRRTLRQGIEALGRLVVEGDKSRSWISSKVLVVDDDGICRETLRSALDLADLPSIIVGEPELALKLAEENSFDLVFLDVDMPGTNGFEVCRKLRQAGANANARVVFVTGLTDLENRTQATASGGDDFIAKPFLLVEMAVKALTYLSKPHAATAVEPPLAA